MATSNPQTHDAHHEHCPQCLNPITHTQHEHACTRCGLVVEDTPIDYGPEWRDYGDGESKSRTATANPNHADRGLGSQPRHTRSADSDEARRDQVNQHVKSGTKKDRNRGYATTEIQRMQHAMSLPDSVGARAKHIFRTLHAHADCSGYDLDVLTAAALHLASREQQLGRTLNDLEAVARTSAGEVRARMHWVASKTNTDVPPPSVEARTRVVASRLDASRETAESAVTRAVGYDEGRGASPSTLAAVALYETGEWTQAVVGEAAGVTPAGLRACRNRVSE